MDERDAFDYPQDYRAWVKAGRPDPLRALDEKIEAILRG